VLFGRKPNLYETFAMLLFAWVASVVAAKILIAVGGRIKK
jgi:hypothetical protein